MGDARARQVQADLALRSAEENLRLGREREAVAWLWRAGAAARLERAGRPREPRSGAEEGGLVVERSKFEVALRDALFGLVACPVLTTRQMLWWCDEQLRSEAHRAEAASAPQSPDLGAGGLGQRGGQ